MFAVSSHRDSVRTVTLKLPLKDSKISLKSSMFLLRLLIFKWSIEKSFLFSFSDLVSSHAIKHRQSCYTPEMYVELAPRQAYLRKVEVLLAADHFLQKLSSRCLIGSSIYFCMQTWKLDSKCLCPFEQSDSVFIVTTQQALKVDIIRDMLPTNTSIYTYMITLIFYSRHLFLCHQTFLSFLNSFHASREVKATKTNRDTSKTFQNESPLGKAFLA